MRRQHASALVLLVVAGSCLLAAGQLEESRRVHGQRSLLASPASGGPPGPLDPFGSFTSKEEALAALQQALHVDRQPASGVMAAGGSGGVSAAFFNVPDKSMRQFWEAWKFRFKKVDMYRRNPRLEQARFPVFRNNVKRIASSLADVANPNWSRMNSKLDAPFTDRFGVLRPGDYDVVDAEPLPPSLSGIQAWDWRARGVITDAKDQGACWGCWAFAAVGAIEAKWAISVGARNASAVIDLSEQQLLDCVTAQSGFGSIGCGGGYLEEPLIYASRGLGFITTEAAYPFNASSDILTPPVCNASRLSEVEGSAKYELAPGGFDLVRPFSAAALREAVLVQPVIVGFHATDMYRFYGGGVWLARQCSTRAGTGLYPVGRLDAKKALMNHAVLVVGFNMTARPPYWIIKNSWGKDTWGEQGFGKVEMVDAPQGSWGSCYMYSWLLKPAELMPREGDPVRRDPPGTTVRLVPGNSRFQFGRLEVLRQGGSGAGVWGTVCRRDFDPVDATVVCRALQLGTSGYVYDQPQYGQGPASQPIWLSQLECTGEETTLEQCTFKGWGGTGCTHAEDVSIECGDALPRVSVRLVNPDGNLRSGRLEVFRMGRWGTVCDDGIDDQAAAVVCQSLGLGSSGIAIRNAPFGPGAGPILLSRVACTGSEVSLEGCRHAGWGNATGCTHEEDVGIECLGENGEADTLPGVATVRLVGTTNATRPRQGRLEILNKGVWGSVCDDGADTSLANVACAMLGFRPTPGVPNRALTNAFYGPAPEASPIWMDGVACTGRERKLEECPFNGWGITNCLHSEDVGIACGEPVEAAVRLAVGTTLAGRLEVRQRGQWGTVCSQGFDPADAAVACRTMGLGSYGEVLPDGSYPAGSGSILADVACPLDGGTSFLDCASAEGSAAGCEHSQDVSISCTDKPADTVPVRLVDGPDPKSGRLEVLRDGVWGTVCDDGATNAVAGVVCRQAGLGQFGAVRTGPTYGEGSGPILLDQVRCSGSEARLENCTSSGWGKHDCTHAEDLGIDCLDSLPDDPPPDLFKFAGVWGKYGSNPGKFNYPFGIAVDPATGEVHVADVLLDRVQRFRPPGTLLGTFGSGSAPAALNSPSGLAVSDGRVWVADPGNLRIAQYTTSGTFVSAWLHGSAGTAQITPMGIAVYGDLVYFADREGRRVSVYFKNGTVATRFGFGVLQQPTGLALSPDGQTVYVSDNALDRVVPFSPSGQPLEPFTGGPSQIIGPGQLCVSEDGLVVVPEWVMHRILIYSSNGTYLTQFGREGSKPGEEFLQPKAVACTTDGSRAIYVADTDNSRVVKYERA